MKRSLIYLLLVLLLVNASTALAAMYYVDSVGGNDSNDGMSEGQAWQNLTKVSSTTFSAGDQILLKCGSAWSSQTLWPKGSGSAGNPIVIDKYGDGVLPLLNGEGAVQNVVYLYNQEYWEINNLEITNYNEGDDQWDTSNLKRGVYFAAEDTGVMHHIYLKNLEIHNINSALGPGHFPSKNGGGIFWEIVGTTVKSWYEDILIEDCHIYNVDRGGISNMSPWRFRDKYSDEDYDEERNQDFVPSFNYRVRNCVFENIGGNALIMRCARGAIAEYNTFNTNGTKISGNAMFIAWSDDGVAQYNESYGQVYEPGETDAAGFDADVRNKGTIFQYNYSHDNGQAAFVICTASSDPEYDYSLNETVRYNVCINNDRRTFYVTGAITDCKIYNNTVYLGPEFSDNLILYHRTKAGAPTNTQYYNNIFYNLSSNASYLFDSVGDVFMNNVFYGNHPASEPADANKLTSDPKFVAVGSGGIGLDSVDGYMLLPGSPCIDSGMTVPDNGGLDYWGNAVPFNGVTDRGAYEYPLDYNDHSAPGPDPIGFVEEPNALTESSITMTAAKAVDPNGFGVQYYFSNITDLIHDSGWQGSETFIDTGLNPNTTYSYKVKARDVSPNYNETSYSAVKSATTLEDMVIYPEADTFVRAGTYADDNYGTDVTLCVKTATVNYIRRSFLRFDLSGVNGTIISATLRLYVNRRDAATTHDVNFVSTDAWSENTITWNNQPASGAMLDSDSVPTAGNWIEFDVTSQVLTELAGDGKISLMVHDSTAITYTLYDSKETATGSNKPQLVISQPLAGDFEPDGDVDNFDLETFVEEWVNTCTGPGWCNGCDIDRSGIVDSNDFNKLAENWRPVW